MFYYTDIEYARKRLQNTVVKTNSGVPVYIKKLSFDEYSKEAFWVAENLLTEMKMVVPFKELDLTPVKLGYVNCENGVGFCYRAPIRAWQQGLHFDVLYYDTLVMDMSPSWPPYFLGKTIVGDYPSLDICKKSKKRKAFHRFWCYDPLVSVIRYKNKPVADLSGKLFPRHAYLQERLDKVLS